MLIAAYLVACVVAGAAIPFLADRVDLVPLTGVALLGAFLLLWGWRFRNSGSFALFAVLVLFALTHWQELVRMQVSLAGIPIGPADVVLLAFVLVQVAAAALDPARRGSLRAPPEVILLAVFSLVGLILGFVFGNQTYYVLKHWRNIIYLILIFLATLSLLRTKAQVGQAVQVLLVMGLLAAITLWRWSINSANVSLAHPDLEALSVQAIVKSMDVTSNLYVSAYMLVLCRLLLDAGLRKWKQLLHIALLLFLLATIVFSVIRANWIATGLGTFYALIVSRRLKLIPAFAVLVGLLIGGWATIQVISSITAVDPGWILADRLNLNTGEARIEDVRQALVAVSERQGWLFGNGLGATTGYQEYLAQYYSDVADDWTGVHNSYVWYYLNLGLAGLLCLIVLIGRILRTTFAGMQCARGQEGEWVVMAANVMVLTLAVLALSSNTYQGGLNSIASVAVIWAIALRTGQLWTGDACFGGPETPPQIINQP